MRYREPRIYLLPNLLTAGNLFCGFLAILQVFDQHYYNAIGLILGACLFDLFDGRVARLAHQESPFGQEFDSIADIVSFGVAPAFLVWQIVLAGIDSRIGWVIAFVYLLCGAMRLARFNCMDESEEDDDPETAGCFEGLPIPAAAGVISSLTLFIVWQGEGATELGFTKFILPALMLLLSYLMFSSIPYPAFKKVDWRVRRPAAWVLGAILVVLATIMWWEWMPALLFLTYMMYGILRPLISRRMRREIELEAEYMPTEEDLTAPRKPQSSESEKRSNRAHRRR